MWFNLVLGTIPSFVGNHRNGRVFKSKSIPDKLCPFSLLHFSLATSQHGYMHFVLVPGLQRRVAGRFSWGFNHVFRHGNPGLYFWFCGHQCVVGRIERLPKVFSSGLCPRPFIYTSVLKQIKNLLWIVNVHGITFPMLFTLFLICWIFFFRKKCSEARKIQV